MHCEFRKINKSILILICIMFVILFSCSKTENIDISQSSYIINLNSNIVHKPTCQTVTKMSVKNKIISDEPIENILMKGYAACKDCKPDRDAKYVVSEGINEFERILHDEFGFGKDYTDKVLKLLSNLYEGINTSKRDNYHSNIEYHKLLASTVYQNKNTWSLIAGNYSSKDEVIKQLKTNYNKLKINDKSYFDDKSINDLYDEVIRQHDVKSGNTNDFAHMSTTISVYAHYSFIKDIAGVYVKKYNGITDIEAQSGYIGDICGTNGTKPSMNKDDYAADLDAVNIYKRFVKNKNEMIYEIFLTYYKGIQNNTLNRASEFLENVTIERINQYRILYSNFMLDENGFNYTEENKDYLNRMNYYDNFVEHLLKNDQNFESSKYYSYTEY